MARKKKTKRVSQPRARIGVPGKEFTLYGELPGLNEVVKTSRGHGWQGSYRSKTKEDERVVGAVQMARIKPITGMVYMFGEFYQSHKSNGARKDRDNIKHAWKYLFDGMKKQGMIPDDNPYVIADYDDCIYYDADCDMTKVTAIPVPVEGLSIIKTIAYNGEINVTVAKGIAKIADQEKVVEDDGR